jgi:hypothetical protein
MNVFRRHSRLLVENMHSGMNRIHDARCRTQKEGCKIHDAGSKALYKKCNVHHESCTVHRASWILNR